MDRSPGFGSTDDDYSRYSHSVSLRLPYSVNLATTSNSLTHDTKGTPSRIAPLRLLVHTWFQVLFHSPPGVLFAFPSQYLFTIGQSGVFSLRGWSPYLQTGFLVSRSTRRKLTYIGFHLRGYHPVSLTFPDDSVISMYAYVLWATPRSLAATSRISVDFFSSRYLDVSVPSVSLLCTYLFSTG